MNILLILIPCSLILGGLALVGFLWTIRSDQYEDPDGNAWRILNEDNPPSRRQGPPT